MKNKDQEIETLQRDIEGEKAKIYSEFGGDVREILDDRVNQKISDILKKVGPGQATVELDKDDHDQLDIMKV